MRKKEFPFPALLFLGLFLINFLTGSARDFGSMLFILVLFLGIWYFFGPDLEPSADPEQRFYQQLRRREAPQSAQDPQGLLLEAQMRAWSAKFYEDRAFRRKLLAFVLALLLAGTAVFTWFNENVIRWRAALLMDLCALGLLTLLIDWLWHRLRQSKEESDRTAYPAPRVNMNYDHDAAADARVRSLQQRLDRLEEWKRSGLIDSAEYEELRKKYLNIKTDHGTAGTERGTNGKRSMCLQKERK